jgi:hypothetical protein
MKITAALIAAAYAADPVNWPGQSDEDPCGTQVRIKLKENHEKSYMLWLRLNSYFSLDPIPRIRCQRHLHSRLQRLQPLASIPWRRVHRRRIFFHERRGNRI